jgi:integrase
MSQTAAGPQLRHRSYQNRSAACPYILFKPGLGHADMTTTMKYYTAVGDLDDLANLLPDFDV